VQWKLGLITQKYFRVMSWCPDDIDCVPLRQHIYDGDRGILQKRGTFVGPCGFLHQQVEKDMLQSLAKHGELPRPVRPPPREEELTLGTAAFQVVAKSIPTCQSANVEDADGSRVNAGDVFVGDAMWISRKGERWLRLGDRWCCCNEKDVRQLNVVVRDPNTDVTVVCSTTEYVVRPRDVPFLAGDARTGFGKKVLNVGDCVELGDTIEGFQIGGFSSNSLSRFRGNVGWVRSSGPNKTFFLPIVLDRTVRAYFVMATLLQCTIILVAAFL
jgi:hypothetical protein